MKPGLGWMHIKDYRHPEPAKRQAHVDEETLKHFVPADLGDSGHEAIFKELREHRCPSSTQKLRRRGIPGVFLDLEPHVKAGGQFGGFSGPDGMGVALRWLCRVLDYVGDRLSPARLRRHSRGPRLLTNFSHSRRESAGVRARCPAASLLNRLRLLGRFRRFGSVDYLSGFRGLAGLSRVRRLAAFGAFNVVAQLGLL